MYDEPPPIEFHDPTEPSVLENVVIVTVSPSTTGATMQFVIGKRVMSDDPTLPDTLRAICTEFCTAPGCGPPPPMFEYAIA